MKKFLGTIFILALVFVGIFLWLNYSEQKALERERIEQRKQELEEIRKREDEAARKRQEMIRQQRAARAETYRQSKDKRTVRTYSRSTPPPPAVSHRAVVENACRKSGCRLVKYQEQGNSSYIMVEGPTHTSVSGLLDTLLREGMRDFTEHRDQYKARVEGVRRIYSAGYTIKW